MLKGIDLSAFQKNVDFQKVRDAGIQFCIFRGGYGNSRDIEFLKHVQGAKAAGIPVLGVYHFIYVNGLTATQNALRHIANVKSAGLDPAETWMFCDVEYDTFTKLGRPATKSECTRIVKEFLDTLVNNGCKKVSIYTNADYYVHYLDWSVLKPYRAHLWLADLNGGPDYECGVQQYSFTGKVAGISGNVDLNYLVDETMMGAYQAQAIENVYSRKTPQIPGGALVQLYTIGTDVKIYQESNGWGYTGTGWIPLSSVVNLEGYTDMDIKEYVRKEVKAALAEERQARLSGTINDSLAPEFADARAHRITDGSRPNDYCTRAEAAVMAERARSK